MFETVFKMPIVRVPEILKEKGWTATYLMRKSGLSWPTIQGLASGKPMNIKLDTIQKLCDALDVGIEDLILIDVGNGK
jgi:DNA-binding Xre family transcriptional regulator